jgi:hypothetical protein
MEPLEGCPTKILGFSVKTRWQTSLNYLLPSIIELLVYISVMVIDGALVYQHMYDRHFRYCWITLGLIFVPAVVTFICVLFSDQWPVEFGFGSEKGKFLARQVTNFLLFPLCAIYRWV